MKFLVINGPNLNLLGQREPELYGSQTLDDLNRDLAALGAKWSAELDFFQSNHEGQLVEAVHRLVKEYDGAVINAGAYSHTSLALRDAVLSVKKPVVEVHLTNPAAREHYRHRSFLAGAAVGSVCGFGAKSYELALYWLVSRGQL
ncbi:MAG: type II 3-dehydroquinate dehydratase [Deltaproteobacteria bacterium]|jgi:3-dehydroquinate dehydratase-2|nr:type II 3-dehydroquinate dehydratase [Deltaproteobacteria bacterium]